MQGLTLASLKKHKALIPLFVSTGIGCLGAVVYTLRLAFRNPDVQWKRDGSLSNDEYATKQYKLYSPTIDYSQLENKAPKY